ncbi:MAG: hypothetical protein ACW972_06880 [Promethearchaeota archaeon]|jgi:hypothetical protein
MDDPETQLSTTTIDSEFKREKRWTNRCNFTDEQLRKRDNDLKELQKLYPDVCASWLELAWNFCEFTPKEEQDRIIREKEFEKPPTKKRFTGGIIKNAIKIEDREDLEQV